MEDVREQYWCDLSLTVYLAGPRVNFRHVANSFVYLQNTNKESGGFSPGLLLRLSVLINFFDKKEYPTTRGYYWIKIGVKWVDYN